MAQERRLWTREEHMLAFNLYCKIPFGRCDEDNPKVIELARLLGRTPASVAIKLGNFARNDPEHQARGVKGMAHGAKGELEVWREFYEDPARFAFESELLLAKLTNRRIEAVAEIEERELPKEGIDRERLVRVRVNQHFFRAAVLAAYDRRCCVTGLAVPELLVSSHIIPWATDPRQRMNPRNGLCLNALHDRAFDRGLMWFDEEKRVCFAADAKRHADEGTKWLTKFEGATLVMPKRFFPDEGLLSAHAAAAQRRREAEGRKA